ncbi:peptide/nickel ABC transporter ATP-binding protein [Candidatus Caldarchaeum subterraneum]|uniref:Peptide/nickel ABC transporter ATP-binding protein n=1 Tax=Caldiarchaeum subterraneum TaxID=311458 RepID=E6N2Z7_CALS0|nr:peptide/nickel transport system ATP-binding protein [Candidatus Caldarchaeum subterraneum]BAJ48355.1 peptide/nickel ABC transporter ATP-binding protein [Candidatus Caldarchaeum subterraneum]BAJ51135.1 peptide/nickel ABC transporter ATP-binding protein [Candidatus Caldarchaeum subterraneum]
MTTESLVRTEELKIYFPVRKFLSTVGEVKAVDGVNLSIGRKETVALVGESGCGKTTLGRALLGLVKPKSGKILFDGIDLTTLGERELKLMRRRMGVVFQDPYASLNPSFTVYRIVEEPLVVNKIGTGEERREMVLKALEEVKLNPAEFFASKYPHMLSGGQRQRVAIARAIITKPEFVVTDEPVSMLDASIRVEILLLFREIQKKHSVSFLYITHDLATAKYFSDKIAIMYAGRIVETGPTKAVLSEPRHPYTQALVDAIPDPDPANRFVMRKVPVGQPPSLVNPPKGCRFHPRCPFFMPGKCDVLGPPMYRVGGERFSACFLHEDKVTIK